MTLSDLSLIGKKISVGIIVTVIPFTIIVGGLWLTQHLLTTPNAPKTVVKTLPNAANHENGKSN